MKINVVIDSIFTYKSVNKIFRIGVVNIQDPDEICMSYYFQGSPGGYRTFLVLVSNLIQPQIKSLFLDAIIFLYNSEELNEMDHINLEGIISEREIDQVVKEALRE